MRLLLISISLVYSFVFYIFYILSNWINILSFSSNLLYESIIFFIIGIFFYLKFTTKIAFKIKRKINKDIFLYSLFLIIILIIISSFLYLYVTNIFLLLNLLGLILNLIFFFFLVKYYKKYSILLKKTGVIFLYISTVSWLYYLYNYDFNNIIILTILYSIIFNLLIHIKYSNYISFIFWLLTFISLIYLFYVYI